MFVIKFMGYCESASFFEKTACVILGDHEFILTEYNQNLSIDISKEKIQNQLQNDLIGYTLSAHYALNTYKCGVNINE